MAAIDLTKYAKEKKAPRNQQTLYPRSHTWADTWRRLDEMGLSPNEIMSDAVAKAEAMIREENGWFEVLPPKP